MVELDVLSSKIVTDTKTQRISRSSTLGGISIGSSVVAVESGNSLEIGQSLRTTLETYFNKPVSHLFLTHTHPDHRNGMMAFRDTVLTVSRKCVEDIPRSVKLGRWTVESFDEKLVLGEDKQLELFHVAGHTVGSSIAFVLEERVLFSGDLIFERSVNFGLPFMGFYQNRPKSEGNPEEYIAAYERFKKMKVEVIVPGHGDLIHNAQEYLDTQIIFFKELRAFIIREIEDNKSQDDIILPQLDPIAQAFSDVEKREKKSAARRWLINYLDKLKNSFYKYYSTHPSL
ncbi:MAG: MBL fold metallo-hydrolase [Candidatus Thorarchaeota archaeon]|jgi:glyoxylase-like metal-dependent hydrolase (beta-lactamase superfamily II)